MSENPGGIVVNPNAQIRGHRESETCWCCQRAPVALQTDRHRDGLCPACRRMVDGFWGSPSTRTRKAA